jgi:hypothetical protein
MTDIIETVIARAEVRAALDDATIFELGDFWRSRTGDSPTVAEQFRKFIRNRRTGERIEFLHSVGFQPYATPGDGSAAFIDLPTAEWEEIVDMVARGEIRKLSDTEMQEISLLSKPAPAPGSPAPTT